MHNRWTDLRQRLCPLLDRWTLDSHRRRPRTWPVLPAARQPRSSSIVALDVVTVLVVVVAVHGPFLDGFATRFIAPLGVFVSPSVYPCLAPSRSFDSLSSSLVLSISLLLNHRVPSPSTLHLPTPPPVYRGAAHPLFPPPTLLARPQYTRTIFPIPTYRAPPLPSARVSFIYSAIPSTNASVRPR